MRRARLVAILTSGGGRFLSITIYRTSERPATTADFATVHEPWLAEALASFGPYDRIGVIAPTCLEGVAFWKAVLLAGKTPIMLQYPTSKLSRDYWRREVAAAVDTLAVEALGHFGPAANPELPIPMLDLTTPPKHETAAVQRPFGQGVLAQLSSGTTGFRKGVALSIADVAKQVEAYNQVLKLGPEDCVVSWLPLYHDMGFIATFLMPAMLGVRLVLIDPVAWVERPQTLFELIEKHRGTVCFMPNFGFEVMARQAAQSGCDLSTMRLWVSCSEPTRMASMRRFIDATGVDPSRLSNCYAMAENIFAVTQSDGLVARDFDGAEAVSCGAAIPGVSVKIEDGEVWVKSPYSLTRYEGGEPIVDAEGFYPTGDLGELIDGQLYILGRKRDVMIHAGRKVILSDIDYDVGRLIPGSVGRIATIPVYNELLGTDEAVCLVEDRRFWERNRSAEALSAVRVGAGLEQGRVEFVAPGFITKTSSGKLNRKLTGEQWARADAFRKGGRRARLAGPESLRAEFLEAFPGLAADLPLERQLDSLGRVNASLLLAEYGFAKALTRSLDEILSQKTAAQGSTGPTINIVSLFDADWFFRVMKPVLTAVSNRLGVGIHYQHLCCPPAPVLLSDLIFEDQFCARDGPRPAYNSFLSVTAALRTADLILMDDIIQMAWPAINNAEYPRMSHRFEPAPLSEMMGVRWARYSERNHRLVTEYLPSEAISPDVANRAIDDLESYLGVPIFRIGMTVQFARATAAWDVQYLKDGAVMLTRPLSAGVSYRDLRIAILEKLIPVCGRLRPKAAPPESHWLDSEQPHWCSWLVNPEIVDFVLDRYDSFLVLGKRGSIPYLSEQADKRGKALHFRSDLTCPDDRDYDCVLQTGSWGKPGTDKPIFPLMMAGWGDQPLNVPNDVAAKTPPATLRPLLSNRLIEA